MSALAARSHLVVTASLLSAGAAAIHAAVAGPHLQEYAPLGVLFIATAAGQAAWAALVVAAPSVRLFTLGAIANAGVVGIWIVSRTLGIPVGPEPWQPEAVGALDVAATIFESGVIGVCLVLVAAGRLSFAPAAGALTRFAAVGAVAVAGVTSAAFAAAPSPADHHATPTVPPATAQTPASSRAQVGAKTNGSATPGTSPSRPDPARAASQDALPHEHPAP